METEVDITIKSENDPSPDEYADHSISANAESNQQCNLADSANTSLCNTEKNEDCPDDSFCDLSATLDDLSTMSFKTLFSCPQPTADGNLNDATNQVEPLPVEYIRWFYMNGPKKKGKLKPMVGNDSIRVELAYRDFLEDTKRTPEKVVIRGGLFEVDVKAKHCYPIYWSFNDPDAREQLVRGTWFFNDWMPLSSKKAETIEREHLARWKGLDINEVEYSSTKNTVMHSIKFDDSHVEWNSVTDVMLYKDATVNRAIRNISRRIGVSKTSNGYRLNRGYVTESKMSDKPPRPSCLMFVIHGIGARCDRQKIVRNTNDFRRLCRKYEKRNADATNSPPTRSVYIPIEWRSRLQLNEDILSSITPHKSIMVRQILHNTVLDIMYYCSSYRHQVVSGLKRELNRVYRMFIDRNPDFNGKVNVFAHSLGNVILHDILTNWHPDTTFNSSTADMMPMQLSLPRLDEASTSNMTPTDSGSNEEGLIFDVDTIFSLGSPIALFLCLRGFEPDGTLRRILPHPCRRLYNIYHPADPAAYRVEPLIYPHYCKVHPVEIESVFDIPDSEPLSPELEPPCASDTVGCASTNEPTVAAATSASDEINNFTSKAIYLKKEVVKKSRRASRQLVNVVSSGSRHVINRLQGIEEDNCAGQAYIKPNKNERYLRKKGKQVLPFRVDYILPGGPLERRIGAPMLTAHATYWFNPTLAKFVCHVMTRPRIYSDDCHSRTGRITDV